MYIEKGVYSILNLHVWLPNKHRMQALRVEHREAIRVGDQPKV